jgi:16S rRNA (guanine527-N7)-methyltransferase
MDKASSKRASPNAAADKASALALTPVSRETEARLDRYVALLLEWQAKTNLVAPSTLPELWTRHIADSLQLLILAPNAKVWIDLGSGGGFPGIVLASALAEIPDAAVHLVERNAKKAAFLREALRVTGARGTVHLADIGDIVERISGPVDCVTARALAPLHQLIGFAEPLVRKGATALFLKGQDVETELTEATKYWTIQPQLHSSRTGGGGWIVELDSIGRRRA